MMQAMYSVKSLEEFQEVLRNHEVETSNKFHVFKNPKGFLDENRSISAEMKLRWKDGLPYFHLGTRTYYCYKGKDKNPCKRIRRGSKKNLIDPSSPNGSQLSTKKMDCPAVISVTRIYALPQFQLENPIKSRKNAWSTKIRSRIANNEYFEVEEAYWFNLPSADDHKNHTNSDPLPESVDSVGLEQEGEGSTSKTNARKGKKGGSNETEAIFSDAISPSKNPQARRPNQDMKDLDTFAIKIAITKEGYPKNRISPEDAINIQRGINEIMDNLPEEEELPRFIQVALSDGALVVHCETERSAAWLERYFEGSMLETTMLHTKRASDIPKRVRIAFKTKDMYTSEPETLLRRLRRLNPGVRMEGWQLIEKERAQWQTVRWVFEVDSGSAQDIRERNLELFVGGFGKGRCKVLRPSTAVLEFI